MAARRGSSSMEGYAVTKTEKAAYGVQQMRKATIITTTILATCLSGFLVVPSLPCVSDTFKEETEDSRKQTRPPTTEPSEQANDLQGKTCSSAVRQHKRILILNHRVWKYCILSLSVFYLLKYLCIFIVKVRAKSNY